MKRQINPDNPTPRGFGVQLPNPEGGPPVYYDDCQRRTGMLIEAKGTGYAEPIGRKDPFMRGIFEPQSDYLSTIVNETEGTPSKVDLRIHDGIRNGKEFFRNSGVFSTEYKMVPDPTLITYPAFKSVMMTLVRIWGASSAQASCDDISDGSPEARRFFAPNWMTYLAPPLLARITPPTGVLCERTPEGGLLMIAAEETFDARNPDHMGAARTISDALLPLTMKEFWF